jgi:hypothetical protein
MVSQALIPLASLQHSAMVWLDQYAKEYGDMIPNKDQIWLSMPTKRAVWGQYTDDMTKLGLPNIAESTFIDLWNSIYPNYLIRPWVDITGKCATCYEIDFIRRKSKSSAVMEAARNCHLLHRGGLFMLEREQ